VRKFVRYAVRAIWSLTLSISVSPYLEHMRERACSRMHARVYLPACLPACVHVHICGMLGQGAGPGRRGVAGAVSPPAPHRPNAGSSPHPSLRPRSRLACAAPCICPGEGCADAPATPDVAEVGQVSRDGYVLLGTRAMELSNGRLGPEGATLLAETMREAPPTMLVYFDIRLTIFTTLRAFSFSFSDRNSKKHNVFPINPEKQSPFVDRSSEFTADKNN
jgi:hypothetical protein